MVTVSVGSHSICVRDMILFLFLFKSKLINFFIKNSQLLLHRKIDETDFKFFNC